MKSISVGELQEMLPFLAKKNLGQLGTVPKSDDGGRELLRSKSVVKRKLKQVTFL